MDAIRTLIVAPDPLARTGLATLLHGFDQCAVVGHIDGDLPWVDDVAAYGADVVLLDLGWQGDSALPLPDESPVPVVALVMDEETASAAWQAGVAGVVERGVSAETLVAALVAAAHDLVVLYPDYVPTLLADATAPGALPLDPLTPRETEVLERLAEGLTNKAIAQTLGISDHTVKFHVNAVLTKLDAQSRTEAVVSALRAGVLSL